MYLQLSLKEVKFSMTGVLITYSVGSQTSNFTSDFRQPNKKNGHSNGNGNGVDVDVDDKKKKKRGDAADEEDRRHRKHHKKSRHLERIVSVPRLKESEPIVPRL